MGTERIRACSVVRLVVAVVATTNKAAIKIGITTGKNDLSARFIDFISGFRSKIIIEIITLNIVKNIPSDIIFHKGTIGKY